MAQDNATSLIDDIMDNVIGPRIHYFEETGQSPINNSGGFTNEYVYWLEETLHSSISELVEKG